MRHIVDLQYARAIELAYSMIEHETIVDSSTVNSTASDTATETWFYIVMRCPQSANERHIEQWKITRGIPSSQ